MKKYALLALLASLTASATLVIPYTFAPGPTIQSSQVNANFSAIASNVNALESATNPFNTTLAQVLSVNNSCGSSPINFNGQQALDFIAENLASDPAPGNKGRLFVNSSTNLLKFDDGSTIQTVGGSGSNNLSSVLNSGNSAGAFNIDLNENQLLHARVENQASDPSSGNAGRLYYNTASHALKVDSGSAWSAIGGSQGLDSVLSVSNSAGSTDVNFNQNHAVSMALDNLASDPGSPVAGQIWLNTTSHIPKFYNGTISLAVGNTNTLAQTLALGNSAGSTPIDFNGQQAQHFVLWNNSGSPGTGTPGYTWFDTSNSQIGFETSGSNHYVCSLDQTQTITNHTISGASNTITNIQDASLSTNVALLNGVQTISGKKTFSSPPVLGTILSSSGDTITVPTGTGNDTLVYLNAAQTLGGKTLNAPIITGNTNFSEGQGLSFRAENVGSLPSAGNIGRLVWNTGGQTLAVDNGSTWFSLAGSPVVTWATVLANGNSAGSTNPDFNFNQALHFELENLGSAPSAGNIGRLYYNTATLIPQYDNGSSILTLADTSSIQTLTNKTIVPASNTVSLASGHILVGSAGGAATDVAMSGGVSITNTGVTTVVTNANLTGPITSVGNATSIASQTGTGTKFVVDTSPTLVTPNLGTPSALVGTNITGTASGLTAGTVTTNANLTGVVTSVGNATSIASQTGTGTKFVVDTSPTIAGTLSTTTQTETGAYSNSFAPTASTSGIKLTGTPFTGGTGTTTFPLFLLTDGTAATTWNTSGTYLGVEAVSNFSGLLADLKKAGTSEFTVDGSGNLVANGTHITMANIGSVTPTSGACFGTGGVLGTCVAGTGTVTSVTFTGDGTVLSSTPSSAVTATGTVTAALNTQVARTFLSGPLSGSAASPTFKALTAPTIQKFLTTGSTTGYLFTVSSANATVGATYTNNGNTYTVLGTIAAGTQLFTSQASAPLASGTLTKASGTGDSTITFSANVALATYTAPTSPAPLYIIVEAVGAGGGGGGGNAPTAGIAGQNTYFGAAVITAGGGAGAALAGGAGGTNTVNTSGTVFLATSLAGGGGGAGGGNGTALAFMPGGVGGNSYYGGGGFSSVAVPSSGNGVANSGGGGGGAGNTNVASADSGGGGGAGGYARVMILPTPGQTFPYFVGGGGTGGAGGASNGGGGGSGQIIVMEYYQ